MRQNNCHLSLFSVTHDTALGGSLSWPTLLAKGLEIRLLNHPCKEVDESRFLCTEDKMLQFAQDHCITDLMTYTENVTSCTQIPVFVGKVKAQFLTTNRWILYSRDERLLTRTCNSEIFRYKVQGTYILTLDDPCLVEIGNISLKMQQTIMENITYQKLPTVNLPQISTSRTSNAPVNLENVDLADLKILSLALKKDYSESENSESEWAISDVHSISIWTLTLYVLIVVILGCFIYKYSYKRIRSTPRKENFELEEGGVKSVDSTDSTSQRAIF